MDIVLYPEYVLGPSRFTVEARFVTKMHKDILIQTGYVQMEIYPNGKDFPHTVGSLIVVGKIDVNCMGGDTPKEAYAKINRSMQIVTEILQIAELGGVPSRYRPRPRSKSPLPEKRAGHADPLLLAPTVRRVSK